MIRFDIALPVQNRQYEAAGEHVTGDAVDIKLQWIGDDDAVHTVKFLKVRGKLQVQTEWPDGDLIVFPKGCNCVSLSTVVRSEEDMP